MEQLRISVIERIYASVCDEREWDPALQELSRFAGGVAVFHIVSDSARSSITSSEAVGLPTALVRDFRLHYAHQEIRIAPAAPYGVGVPLLDWQLLSLERIRRSAIYNEFLVPNDIPYLMAVWLKKGRTAAASLSFQRTIKQGPFTHADSQRFSTVIPHLLRAYEVRRLLMTARATQFAHRQVLDGLPFGVILLDESARLIEATRPAEHILRENRLLGYAKGGIHAMNPAQHHLLARAIDKVCRGSCSTASATIELRRTSDETLTIIVMPLPRTGIYVSSEAARCMLLVLDPRSRVQAHVSTVQCSLQLTRAEATLAVEMFRSPTLRDAAQKLGRSYNTCKTQLKSVYAKAEVRSQVELAQKIMLVSLTSSAGE